MKKLFLIAAIVLSMAQPVYAYRIDNQGNAPYCTAYAVANGIESQMIAQGISAPADGFSKFYVVDKCDPLTIDNALNLAIEGLKGNDGKMYRIKSYELLDTTPDAICNALTGGAIVIVNTKCKMPDWKDGVITDTDTLETMCIHAVYLYAYDDNWIYGVNSWGKNWGDRGTFKMSKEYACFPNILGAYTIKL